MTTLLEQALMQRTPSSVMSRLDIGNSLARKFAIEEQERLKAEAERKAKRESAFNPVLSLLGAGIGLYTGGLGGAVLGALQGIGKGEETKLDKALTTGLSSFMTGQSLSNFAPMKQTGDFISNAGQQISTALNPQNILNTAQLATGSTKGLEGTATALGAINTLNNASRMLGLNKLSTLKDFIEVPQSTPGATEYQGKYYVPIDYLKSLGKSEKLTPQQQLSVDQYKNQTKDYQFLTSNQNEASKMSSQLGNRIVKVLNPLSGENEWYVKPEGKPQSVPSDAYDLFPKAGLAKIKPQYSNDAKKNNWPLQYDIPKDDMKPNQGNVITIQEKAKYKDNISNEIETNQVYKDSASSLANANKLISIVNAKDGLTISVALLPLTIRKSFGGDSGNVAWQEQAATRLFGSIGEKAMQKLQLLLDGKLTAFSKKELEGFATTLKEVSQENINEVVDTIKQRAYNNYRDILSDKEINSTITPYRQKSKTILQKKQTEDVVSSDLISSFNSWKARK